MGGMRQGRTLMIGVIPSGTRTIQESPMVLKVAGFSILAAAILAFPSASLSQRDAAKKQAANASASEIKATPQAGAPGGKQFKGAGGEGKAGGTDAPEGGEGGGGRGGRRGGGGDGPPAEPEK